ncbi:glycosyl hydrolase 115 family protein [Pedobacter sp. MC2016-14]|uniref:glycosyl hydrolase 115 family protein n=1 Tax=Pedobacter sp. MC2016-14 TaxID=2897327 RepID=UPI001E365694|nr:glycosyl hydrolase 115 family protein [Pedobacter sp. MC2016-14]MCD0489170.1 glycosyl hydrolase 115 family protein [Pedobacter sp. MC2016-14]
MLRIFFRGLAVSIFTLSLTLGVAYAGEDEVYVSNKRTNNSFCLTSTGKVADIVFNAKDDIGVIRAIRNLQSDLEMVSGLKPKTFESGVMPQVKEILLVGTVGRNVLIDKLIAEHKLDVSAVKDKWEASITQVVLNPMPGVDKALVIAGSDKRGTIFGIYDLSEQIGVSPWYWWADVAVKPQSELYVRLGSFKRLPGVKYRGIFINDEAPALSRWSKKTFGGFNAKFYEKVFELILRLKGNYFWPAMWGSAFYVDDPKNPELANEMGVIIGTSHHEPLSRAQAEWKKYGGGAWDYSTNKNQLYNFWSEAIEKNSKYENILTIGMRGDGDEPMSESSNVALLEQIVKDQRKIIQDKTGKPAEKTPQVWALYKEVQDYYDKGMRVPDDVTLLLCDDNWGNIRRLPALNEKKRAGGYGIYYHFDYVGGPRNYKWLNTNPITKVWEQMNLAKEYGADRLWIVNVGDIKPMEFPTQFFLDMAWNPGRFNASNLQQYTIDWAKKQFGAQHAEVIADIITKYTKYNGRVKPELLDEFTYNIASYNEFETVVKDYKILSEQARKVQEELPLADRNAFFQLVMHPVEACANLYDLYYCVARNKLYASQGRAAANDMAQRAEELFAKDQQISDFYNYKVSEGKWQHMMDQVHIGYTGWQEPKTNKLPLLERITVPEEGNLGVAIEGSQRWWPNSKLEAKLPQFTPVYKAQHFIELFNKGIKPLYYKISAAESFVVLSSNDGQLLNQERIQVGIDWEKAPKGTMKIPITIAAAGKQVVVYAEVFNPSVQNSNEMQGLFVEQNGYISLDPSKYSRSIPKNGDEWKVLPNHGKTNSAISVIPVTAKRKDPQSSTSVEYDLYLFKAGVHKISTYVSPTLDFKGGAELKFAISIDNEMPKTISLHNNLGGSWEDNVAKNIKVLSTSVSISKPGKHVLKIWMVDPAVVIQKIVLDTGGMQASYLGPPERPAVK